MTSFGLSGFDERVTGYSLAPIRWECEVSGLVARLSEEITDSLLRVNQDRKSVV